MSLETYITLLQRIGKQGARTTIQRYGERFLAEIGRRHRLENPTRLEQTVAAALQDLGFVEGQGYEREGYICPDSHCHHYTGDFVFRPAKTVVYADGERWHQNSEEIGPRTDQDAALDRWLAAHGWTVVRLPEAVIAGANGHLLCCLCRLARVGTFRLASASPGSLPTAEPP